MKKFFALLVAMLMLMSVCAFAETTDASDDFVNVVDTDIEAEITIYTYYADSAIEQIDYAIERMAEKYPNLTINIEHRADSDGTALKTWAAVGELPDIFNIPSADTYDTLLANGDLYALDSALEATDYYSYFENGYELYYTAHIEEEDGVSYSFGADVTSCFVVYYNISLFEELGLSEPTNWEEFKNCITVLAENGKLPIALFGAEQWPGMTLYGLACLAEGITDAFDSVNSGDLTFAEDEGFLRAAEKMVELVELGAFGTGALTTNASQAMELFSSGEAGFLVNGSWQWDTCETDGYSENTGWCHYNVFADDDETAESLVGVCIGGAINKHDMHVNANPPSGLDAETVACLALEFDYYCNVYLGVAGMRTTAIGDYEFDGSDNYADFAETFNTYTSFTVWPADMSDGTLVSSLGNAVEMMITGNYTAEEFIEEMTICGY